MSSETYNTPFDNPYTKAACALGLVWVGYMGIRYAKRDDIGPERRKNRQSLTLNNIDKQIDSRNFAMGGKILKSNPDVPFYSRHNYNRRRRSKDFY